MYSTAAPIAPMVVLAATGPFQFMDIACGIGAIVYLTGWSFIIAAGFAARFAKKTSQGEIAE